MSLREIAKFAAWAGAFLLTFFVGFGAGAGLTYQMGYDDAWENREFYYQDWRPPGEPLDWDKVDRSKLKINGLQ